MATRRYADYMAEINKAVEAGDIDRARELEIERNEIIDSEGLDYEKTYRYQTPQKYTKPQNVTELEKLSSGTFNNLSNITNQSPIKNTVKSKMNSNFKTPTSIQQADAYLSKSLKQIQSGKTSFSDEIQDMMDKITNREKFSYDVDNDQLFQQALASAMNSGKQAMQDTIGQASALTGGFGSSYATSAGNQAYNAFIEDAYDNLPQYYQMAMEAYQMEGDEMYRQLGMYTDADDREYSRLLNAYEATSQYRNRAYDEAYGQFRDDKSDAFALANIQLNEHSQLVNDAYTLYSTASDYEKTRYERSYNEWSDSVSLLLDKFKMQHSGAVENRDYNYQVGRDAVEDKFKQQEIDISKQGLDHQIWADQEDLRIQEKGLDHQIWADKEGIQIQKDELALRKEEIDNEKAKWAAEISLEREKFDFDKQVYEESKTSSSGGTYRTTGGKGPQTLKYPKQEMFDEVLLQ